MKSKSSKIEHVTLFNHDILIKRDDLLDEDFSGNKARKFYYYLQQDFSDVNKIISYGSAQANSLYSLSVLAKRKEVSLDFYVHPMASYLKNNPAGNLKGALNNGANVIEIDVANKHEYILEHILPCEKKAIFIQEGGRVQEAKHGLKILAREIVQYTQEHNLNNIKVMLPSGTGTTALFLQKYLPFEVLTCACVGDETYLKQQFLQLNVNEKEHPCILQRPKKYHFGKLYKEFYDMYHLLLEQTGIEFDLLYDPLGFIMLKHYLQNRTSDEKIIYIHQGGILGNSTMIARYLRKYGKNKQ
jgi:1-aminocyclopropane-1-carboxylate deaminase/D-cysteine desulfhydrase-like pyridoxal-dependent ACC family enzyme